jgi:hypothetical protein
MPLNQRTLHSETGEIAGHIKFLFCEAVYAKPAALAKGYTDMGNFLGMETKSEAAKIPVLSAFGGVVRETRNIPGQIKSGYDLRTCEIADSRKLKFALFGTALEDFAQPALADVAVDPLGFAAAAPAILHVWYPLIRQGKQLRELTAVTFPGMTEGADFLADAKRGLVRFINAATLPAAAIIPTVSCPAIAAGNPLQMRRMKPMTKSSWRGYARLYVFDQDEVQPLAMAHEDFSCEVSLSSPFNIAGDSLSEMKLLVSVGEDTGELLYRD